MSQYTPKPTDRKFKAVLRMGHVGAGRHNEETRIIWARDAVEANAVAQRLGGTKKSKDGYLQAVISIEEVTS